MIFVNFRKGFPMIQRILRQKHQRTICGLIKIPLNMLKYINEMFILGSIIFWPTCNYILGQVILLLLIFIFELIFHIHLIILITKQFCYFYLVRVSELTWIFNLKITHCLCIYAFRILIFFFILLTLTTSLWNFAFQILRIFLTFKI